MTKQKKTIEAIETATDSIILADGYTGHVRTMNVAQRDKYRNLVLLVIHALSNSGLTLDDIRNYAR